MNYLKSSEIVFINGTTIPGPSPPIVKDLSITLINENIAILIGETSTYFFYFNISTWIKGPDLHESRTSDAGLVTFYSEHHQKWLVAAIGGTSNSGNEPGLTVEFLDYAANWKWFAGVFISQKSKI